MIAVSDRQAALPREHQHLIGVLARVDLRLEAALAQPPAQALHHALPGIELYVPLTGVIDLDAERARLREEVARLDEHVASLRARLANPRFVERAPVAVVEKERGRLAEQETLVRTLTERLHTLEA